MVSDLRWWSRIVMGVVVCVIVVAGITVYGVVRTLHSAHEAVHDDHGKDLRDSHALGIAIYNRSSSIRGYLLSGEGYLLNDAARARIELSVRLVKLRANRGGIANEDVNALAAAFARYDGKAAMAIAAREISAVDADAIWESELLPVQDEIEHRFATLRAAYERAYETARARAGEAADDALRLIALLVVSVIAVVLLLIVAYARVTRRLIARYRHEQEQTTFRLLEQVPVGIFVITPDGKPYYLNQTAKKIFGRGADREVRESLSVAYRAFEVGTERPYPKERAPLYRAVLGEISEVTDMEIRREDDQVIPLHMTGAPVYDAAGKLIYAVAGFQDVHQLQRVAMRDVLTGLVNRAAVTQAFVRDRAAAQRRRQPLAIALIDLDRFKSINDTHGHASGDEVLRRTAETLVHKLRRTDIVGRWGGEELVVLLPDTDLDGARVAIEKGLDAVRALQFIGKNGQRFSVTFSAGAVVVERDEALTEVIVRADKLLYAAKEAGRARVHVAAAA